VKHKHLTKMKFLYLLALSLCFNLNAISQGCVAIRGMSSCDGSGGSFALRQGEFMITPGYRYFKSYKHFRGDHEETHRETQGTNVINSSHFIDLGISYGLSNRAFLNVVLPYVDHKRSSMYEHGGNPPNGLGERHVTESKGLGDIRLGLGYWLFDPIQPRKFNASVTLGLKLPTGDFNAQDEFYNQGPNRNETRIAVVDQSIQPGDGGLGLTGEMQGYAVVADSAIMLLGNVFYLMNPSEKNGVTTRNGNDQYSCPDQYAARLGGFFSPKIENTYLYLGGRIEGVKAFDFIGGSEGYRRPGYAVSVEPGISFIKQKYGFNVSVPVAVYRNRVQSVSDIYLTNTTGVFRQGDAAFADYVLTLGAYFRFGH